MMRTIAIWGVLAMLPVLAVGAVSESGPEDDEAGLEIWNDSTFQKEFMGSYGFQADIEPTVDAVEREQLNEILQQMQEQNVDGAIEALHQILEPQKQEGKSRRRRSREPEEETVPSAIFDFVLANLYWQERDDLDNASRYYRSAIAKFPSFRRAYKNLGLVEVRQGDFEGAIESLSKVIELDGDDGVTYGLLGYAYSSTGQFVPAESAYRNAVLLDPGTRDWKLGLTMSVLKQQKYAEAATLCEELIAGEPDNAGFWLLQANAYIGLGQPLRAAENFEIVDRMGKSTEQSLYTLGDIYVNEELWELASRAYSRAVETDPEQRPSRAIGKVEVLAQRGATREAESLIETVQTILGDRLDEGDKKKLLKQEARLAMLDGEGGEDVVEVLEEIVALDPLDGDALILLGQHYAKIDDPEQAIFYFERAASIEEFETDANLRHAQLLVNQSRYDEAVPLLKRAQELDPREDVARFLEQVQRVARSQR
jgi:tetratricopeptide (TPR) repeat protein